MKAVKKERIAISKNVSGVLQMLSLLISVPTEIWSKIMLVWCDNSRAGGGKYVLFNYAQGD